MIVRLSVTGRTGRTSRAGRNCLTKRLRDALSATKGADLTELNRLTDYASQPAEPKSRREVRI